MLDPAAGRRIETLGPGAAHAPPPPESARRLAGISKVLPEPVADAAKEARRRLAVAACLARGLGALGHREMQQPDAGREGRTPRRLGQSGDPHWAADSDLL